MAKQAVAKVVAMTPGLPAHLQNYVSTGAGVPTDQEDFLLPMARVLDPKSPECEKRGPNYVKGAEPGDIYIKNAPVPLIKGETGMIFQPCYRDRGVVEWLPRGKGGGGGGGLVGRHPVDFIELGVDVEQRPHPEDRKKMIWVRKSSGNLLVDTRYVGGYAILENEPPLPLVLPFSSTGHTVAKQWNMLIASKRLGGVPADIWTVFYRIKTHLKSRGDQAWYLFDISDAGPVNPENNLPTIFWAPTAEDIERGRNLHNSLTSRQKTFNEAEAVVTTDEM